jgi:hypothetical protein
MKVRRNSWHCRLYRFSFMPREDVTWYATPSLCGYFWRVVLGMVMMLIIGFMTSMCVFGLASLAYFACKGAVWAVSTHAAPSLLTLAALVAVYGIVRLVRRGFDRETETPSLIVAYVRAVKQKVCPLIEFVDGAKKP